MKVFDANAFVGPYSRYIPGSANNVSMLLEDMDRYGIEKALVFSAMAQEVDIIRGNKRILKETESEDRLIPAWVLLPHYSGEVPLPRENIEIMLGKGVKAVWLFPGLKAHSISEWALGETFIELEKAKIPVFIDFGDMHWQDPKTDYDKIHKIATEHSELPIILVRQSLATTRNLISLMSHHENLFIETSTFLTSMGIKRMIEKTGVNRLLFGSGLPLLDAGCPLTMILKSGLTQKEKEAILYDNLSNLLKGVES